jgi:DNA repair photolyase
MGKMFNFITATWNPLGGECLHKCSYCWARQLASKNKMDKYTGKARLFDKELHKHFKADDFVFVCDMTDLFGAWVPTEIIQAIFESISKSPAKFLLLTKNPEKYRQLIATGVPIPLNCVLGCTVESDVDHLSSGMQERARLMVMMELQLMGYPVMLSIEPIMDYSTNFLYLIKDAKPDFVAIGYDNYNNGLPEPYLAKTMGLIQALEQDGIKVYRKTLREKCLCMEKKVEKVDV